MEAEKYNRELNYPLSIFRMMTLIMNAPLACFASVLFFNVKLEATNRRTDFFN